MTVDVKWGAPPRLIYDECVMDVQEHDGMGVVPFVLYRMLL